MSGRTAVHDKVLERLAALPASFVRCHRSHLVNLAHTLRLVSGRGSCYVPELRDGTRLRVGRSRLPMIRGRLG